MVGLFLKTILLFHSPHLMENSCLLNTLEHKVFWCTIEITIKAATNGGLRFIVDFFWQRTA